VVIHGKAGNQGPIQALAQTLRKQGATVLTPSMSWNSGYRPYEDTVQEVAAAVSRLRQSGLRKVFLAGHSMGANISMGYVAAGGRVDGVIAMAPGHRPDFIATVTGDSLERARAMVAAGRGNERAEFSDWGGRVMRITTTARAYLGFFDPDGPAGRAARAQGVNVPVLWVIGRSDRPAMRDNAPYTTGQRIEVDGNHQQTPVAAVPHVIAWITSR
jgi:pimeloyl-ACP methyl ester carboxylesterase